MKDPGSMSLTAILVLTVVVLGLMGAWLGMIFFVARQGGHGGGRLDEEAPGHASRPEAG
jgi:hypothetical protein